MTEHLKGASRRDFLKGTAAGTALGGAGLPMASAFAAEDPTGAVQAMRLLPHPTISEAPGTNEFWAEVRSAFALPEDYIHMNTGTTGSQPTFAQNNLLVYSYYRSQDPRDWRQNLAQDFPALFPVDVDADDFASIHARQAQIARMFGANDDEIVLSYNTTDGCNMVFAGTPWQPGDRIVTTNLEHPAMLGPIRWARDYRGVDVKVVGIPSNLTDTITMDGVMEMFDAELRQQLPEGNRQYLAISEISYKNGLRFPVKELAAMAGRYGGYSIIDSAHGWGMVPINCHDYGADFISGAGYKWLCGGPGTGILYVRNHGDDLPPFAMGNFYRYDETYERNRDWSPADKMQARGTYNRPALYALSDTANFWNHIGLERIFNRGISLANYLRDKIADKWGSEALWVPNNQSIASATFLTAFNPFAMKDDARQFEAMDTALNGVVDLLANGNPKIYVRTNSWHDAATIETGTPDDRAALRVSTHAVYNSEEQIDLMFDRLVTAIDGTRLEQLGR